MNSRANIIEELPKAILFMLLAIAVFILIAKLVNQVQPVPLWSKALSATERAIHNLDSKQLDLTRTANVQLPNNYFIKGFNGGNCDRCICVCDDPECSNIMESKYCKEIEYYAENFLLVPDDSKPHTYRVGLEDINGKYYVKLMGVVG